ncbi:hypothetical protein ABW20_dc0100965 [Dactylellina cionopaga]|nr:hypothetical protein ABW20_dc0100965 [Dactylellina cionopaga]
MKVSAFLIIPFLISSSLAAEFNYGRTAPSSGMRVRRAERYRAARLDTHFKRQEATGEAASAAAAPAVKDTLIAKLTAMNPPAEILNAIKNIPEEQLVKLAQLSKTSETEFEASLRQLLSSQIPYDTATNPATPGTNAATTDPNAVATDPNAAATNPNAAAADPNAVAGTPATPGV